MKKTIVTYEIEKRYAGERKWYYEASETSLQRARAYLAHAQHPRRRHAVSPARVRLVKIWTTKQVLDG